MGLGVGKLNSSEDSCEVEIAASRNVMQMSDFVGGGCGVGFGLGWGFGSAFGTRYIDSRVRFRGIDFSKGKSADARDQAIVKAAGHDS